MKFAIKSLAVAAAVVAAGAASAQTTLTVSAGGSAVNVVDPAGSGRVAKFQLLSSFGSYSSSGNLSFSSGLYDPVTNPDVYAVGGTLGALNVGNVTITGTGTAPNAVVVTESWRSGSTDPAIYATKAAATAANTACVIPGPGPNGECDPTEITRVGSVAAANIGSISAIIDGPNAGQVLVANSLGGAKQVGTKIAGTLTGGTAIVENIRFDIAGGNVIADLRGTKNAVGTVAAQTFTNLNTTLWTFNAATDVVGPTRLNPASLLSADPVAALTADGYTLLNTQNVAGQKPIYTVLAQDVISNLSITTAGRNFFVSSLGLQATGVNALDGVNGDPGKWGTVFSNLVFQVQEVPEPSTYALMGLGLVGISLVARRRAAK